jgi:hypothetical protein
LFSGTHFVNGVSSADAKRQYSEVRIERAYTRVLQPRLPQQQQRHKLSHDRLELADSRPELWSASAAKIGDYSKVCCHKKTIITTYR